MENYLKKSYTATISDVDFNSRLSLASLLKEYQFLATEHSKIMGMSYFDLMKNDKAFWVLSKIKVKILKALPNWGDAFSVLTYPKAPTNVRYGRNFKVFDEDENLLAISSSEWCILDVEARKLRRASSITSYPNELKCLDESLETENYTNIDDALNDNMLPLFEKVVRTTDLDMNLHMNNVVYTKIVLDCFSANFLKEHQIREYELHFIKEAPEGTKIDVYKKEVDDNIVIFGKSTDKLLTYFKAVINFDL